MAYTIISQNNSTTTLSDGVNTITVPSRVNLTSGNFTIVEVNNSMATLEDGDGNVYRDIPCVAVLSGSEGGGGDQHNLGWYATESALTTAHPTASNGDWAIVGSTDTVWVWDSDTTAWKDTDTKGQVTSVNGQTGAVTVGTLPSQTGNAGKFLTTDGTDASWSDTVPAINLSQSLSVSADTKLVVFKNGSTEVGNISATQNGPKIVSGNPNNWGVGIAGNLVPNGDYNLGWSAFGVVHKWNKIYVDKISSGNNNISVPNIAGTMAVQVSTVPTAGSTLEGQIYQYIGATDSTYTNGHFYKCVSDGQATPTYSWTEVQLGGGSSLPSQTGNAGKFLTTDGTAASWSDKPLVNTATGTSALTINGIVSTAQSTINIGDNSKTQNRYSVAIGNGSQTTAQDCTAVGYASKVKAQGGVSLGQQAQVETAANDGIAIGHNVIASASHSIQLGTDGTKESGGYSTLNSDANTLKVGNANGNFEIMSADGTIPAARHASLPAADGTYVLKLVIASGVPTLSWVAE